MKTFYQFMEQSKLNLDKRFTNTTDAIKNVFSGKGVGELTQKVKSGEINIGDKKKVVQSDEVKGGLEGIVQGLGKDANIRVTKFLKKVENFKLPTK